MFINSLFINFNKYWHNPSIASIFFSLGGNVLGVIRRWTYLKFFSPKKTLVDPSYEYYLRIKNRYSGSFETAINYNTNVDVVFYSKPDFQELMKQEMNYLEKQWRTRILFETTPRGNIIMFYDVYKQGFAYYCDANGIPYNILNAVAMKYVLTFYCRDFFVDNNVSRYFKPSTKILKPTFYDSVLIPIHFLEDKVNKKGTGTTSFVKAKNYGKNTNNNVKMSFGNLVGLQRKMTFADKIFQIVFNAKIIANRLYSLIFVPKESSPVIALEDKPEKEYNYNRFVCLGKISNFRFLQLSPVTQPLNGFESKLLDNLKSETALQKQVMRYSDFKLYKTGPKLG